MDALAKLLHEGSLPVQVVSGLKQRILKLEQQCREKENALRSNVRPPSHLRVRLEDAIKLSYPLSLFSKLQSELRTTNLEELKITVETYFEEVNEMFTDVLKQNHHKDWEKEAAILCV